MKYKQIIMVLIVIAASLIYTEYPKWLDYSDEQLHVYFLDVGQGDSALVKLPDRRLILLDGGPNRSVMFKLSETLPFWVNRINLVIATHSHADHINGLSHIAKKYDIDCLIYKEDDPAVSVVEDNFRAVVQNIPRGNCLEDLGAIQLSNYIVNMDKQKVAENQNLESIVTLLSYYDFDILFTGDAEVPVLSQVVPKIKHNIEVLKVPHHGSRDAYYVPLIHVLRPNIAVISVGRDNRYHLPKEDVIEDYQLRGVQVLRTDFNGTIHIRSDGFFWEVIE